MAIARLVPSILYNQAGDSYLEVSNENNAFTNTDSDTYATVENVYSRTSNRYVYLQGFNWDAIPSNAIINSFRILLKARESNGSTSSSYRPVLAKGTSTYNDTYCSAINTTTSVHEFTFKQDFNTFRDDGEEFGIRINCRRGSRNTVSYHYIYGAEIEVDYTVPSEKYLWTKDTTWHRWSKAWKKVNGTWTQQSDLTTVFQSGVNYIKG